MLIDNILQLGHQVVETSIIGRLQIYGPKGLLTTRMAYPCGVLQAFMPLVLQVLVIERAIFLRRLLWLCPGGESSR